MSYATNKKDLSISKNKLAASFIAFRLHHIKKFLKPLVKLIHKSKKRSDLERSMVQNPTPSEDFTCELSDNAANEALEERLRADLIARRDAGGGVLTTWSAGRTVLVPVYHRADATNPEDFRGDATGPDDYRVNTTAADVRVPPHFARTTSGDFAWAPLPDRDICWRGDELVFTGNQTPEEQVPVGKCRN
uniref:Uncharacterized protein n=1 Tax=Timema cristinae TaxID=61476 RepID=A0A7R9DLA0_TIMCR|nr:unnamed protein product [Timema cristinae]